MFVVAPEDEERFRGGHVRELHRRHYLTTKIVNGHKLIAYHGLEYSVCQLALQLASFNVHMVQSRHGPEVKFRLGALCPAHSGLKQSLGIQGPTVELQEREYFVIPLGDNGELVRKRVARCFHHMQKAFGRKSFATLKLKRQWQLLAAEEDRASWVSCVISPIDDRDLATLAHQQLTAQFQQLNADFRRIAHRVLCPSARKHASWIWTNFMLRYKSYYKSKMKLAITDAEQAAVEQQDAERNPACKAYYHRRMARRTRERRKEFDWYKQEAHEVVALLQRVVNYADDVLPGPKLQGATAAETAAWEQRRVSQYNRYARGKKEGAHRGDATIK